MKTHYIIPFISLFLFLGLPTDSWSQVQPPAEICDNGIDDDGDGLVDCFDPDCCTPACGAEYYNECPTPPCQYRPDSSALTLSLEWSYGNNWHEYNTPIVADIDGDGFPEVIGKKGPYVAGTQGYDDLLVVNGQNGQLEATIQTPIMQWINNAVGVMDADSDGYGEIYFTTSHNPTNVLDRNRLICYEYLPATQTYAFKWRSVGQINQPTGAGNNANNNLPNFADFNQDGIPEIYVRNQIFNGLTGVQIVNGDTNSVGATSSFSIASRFGFPLAYDVLPDNACADCAGLELIAGNQVYSVNIDPANAANNRMTVQRQATNKPDGYTAIVDIDRDGDLDGIISSAISNTQVEVYVWDLQTNTVLYSYVTNSTNSSISRANAADFDGDGLPEFGICTTNRYTVLEVVNGNLVQKWTTVTTDGSGGTSSTVFDFDGDAKSEVIYRDETTLYIFEGATGQVLFQTACSSGTSNEYPTIVDVDADGETELVCSCGGELRAYKSGNEPWIPTRQIWNQNSYHNTNVNSDLTIPRVLQSPHIVGDSILMNTFLSQIQLNAFPAPDIITQFDFVGCKDDSLILELTLCNDGNLAYPAGSPISFYTQNPTTSVTFPILTTLTPFQIDTTQCWTFSLTVPNLGFTSFFAVANDDFSIGSPYNLATDFPITSVGECNFLNNIDEAIVTLPQLQLPDTLRACGPDSVRLGAGPDWIAYQWTGGFVTDSIWANETGLYSVNVTDSLNCMTDAESFVRILDANVTPEDTILCLGDSINLQATADTLPLSYSWSTNEITRLIRVSPTQSTVYQVTVSDGSLSCTDTASVMLMAAPQVNLGPDTVTICVGDSIWLATPAGQVSKLWQDGSTGDSLLARQAGFYWMEASNICGFDRDSIYLQVISPPMLVNLGADTLICAGDSITLNAAQPTVSYLWQDNSTNSSLAATTAGIYWVMVSNQCGDRIDSLTISPLADPQNFSLGADTVLCVGDSIWLSHSQPQLNNRWVDNSTGDSLLAQSTGIYWLEISNLCGSLRDSINIGFQTPPAAVNLGADTLLCAGDSILLDASQPLVSYLWQDNSTANTLTVNTASLYWVIVSNQCGSQADSIVISTLAAPQAFSLGPDSTLCQGDSLWLSHSQPQLNNLWVDNSTGDSLLAQVTGLYWLEISNACGSLRDSINIDFQAPPAAVNLGADTLLCAGDSLILDASQTNVTYQWQDNSANATLTANFPSLYWVIVSNGCGATSDSLTISPLADPLPFSLGADTTLCEGGIIWISHSQPQLSNLWIDNSTGDSLLVQNPGTYWLEISNLCGSLRDSIDIDYLAPPDMIFLGNDTVLCEGANLLLQSNVPGLDYLWGDGSTGSSFLVTSPNIYWVEGSNDCGARRDSIRVEYLRAPVRPPLGNDSTLCTGDSLFVFFPLQNQVNYLWEDGTTDPFRWIFETGTFVLTASNQCGTEEEAIDIEFQDPPVVPLPSDTILCEEEILVLDLFNPDIDYYLWQDGSRRPGFFVKSPGVYQAQLGNGCDTTSGSITVEYEPCECQVFMANAFTPNDDGHNDEFMPVYNCNADFVTFTIYDRWGQLVFAGNSLDAAWNGTFQDKSCLEGVYVWHLKYSWNDNGISKNLEKKGSVTLIR